MLNTYQKVLITGGMGFIGHHLTNALLQLGKEIIVLDDLSRSLGLYKRPDIKFVQADIRDRKQLIAPMQGIDIVFHTAANASGTVSVEDPRLDFEVNTVGTFNVAEAACNAGVKRFVYLSSASVYGTPQRFPMDEDHPTKPFVPYGASKLSGEVTCLALCRSVGLPVVVGRPFCVYGPGENPKSALVEITRYLRWHLNDLPIEIVGDVDKKTRDFVNVRDLVSGLLCIAEHANAGEVFNIGSGEEISMRQVADIIGAATGREATIKAIPEITADTYRLVGDITKIRSLGYRPQCSLLEGIREIAAELGAKPELPSGATIFRQGQHAEAATADAA